MTVSSGFFDSVNHDRLYNADQVSSMFDGLILDGVYENMGDAFAINAYPDAENTVIVGTGRAWFDHTWTLNDTQYALTLDPPSDSMSRIDAIVLDVDKTLEVRNNTIKLIKGTPVFTGGDPQKPTLVKEDLHNQYPLAYIARSAGASATINQADIEYMVGTDECPMVIGLLEAINIEQVYAQLKDEFYLWWDGVILGDPDMATHLQDQIDELTNRLNNSGVGLLTSAAYEMFKSGNIEMTVNSYNIPSKISGTKTQFGQTYRTILPDGRVLCAYFYSMTNNSMSDPTITFSLTNSDGVTTYTDVKVTCTDSKASGYLFICAICDSGVESYPITIYTIHMMDRCWNDFIESPGRVFVIGTHVLQLEGTISSSFTTYTFADSKKDSDANYHNQPSASLNEHGDIGFIVGGKDDQYGQSHVWSIVIDSNGLITSDNDSLTGLWGAYISTAPDEAGTKVITNDSENNRWISNYFTRVYADSAYHNLYLTLDYTTKQLGIVKDTSYPGALQEYYYGYNEYSGSETEGFLQKKHVPSGNGLTTETNRISDYYLGASNLGEPLPEGSLIVVPDQAKSIYRVIGPNKEKMVIGSNGGVAVLKNKSTISAPDSSSIVTNKRGYLELDGKIYMLYSIGVARYVVIK